MGTPRQPSLDTPLQAGCITQWISLVGAAAALSLWTVGGGHGDPQAAEPGYPPPGNILQHPLSSSCTVEHYAALSTPPLSPAPPRPLLSDRIELIHGLVQSLQRDRQQARLWEQLGQIYESEQELEEALRCYQNGARCHSYGPGHTHLAARANQLQRVRGSPAL
ncbi:UNVERIFIED_CONTAM: hypothetical protein FKN15_052039 [Acipenser sinensis]